MANFYKGTGSKGFDEKKYQQTLAVGGDSIIFLYGGGPPPDNVQLTVTTTDSSVCSIVELDAIDYTHRRFRVTGKGAGTCQIEGRVGAGGIPYTKPLDIVVDAAATVEKPKTIPDLVYDGQQLSWPDRRLTFKATSGIYDKTGDYRDAKEMCYKDHGPVPEGLYSFSTQEDSKTYARDDGTGTCTLSPASPVQVIPRGGDPSLPASGGDANQCEPYWANWGTHRVRLEPADHTARTACNGSRGGFYIHDSTKGFSHGCIETEEKFFQELSTFTKSSKRKTLTVRIKYTNQSTYGGTYVPKSTP